MLKKKVLLVVMVMMLVSAAGCATLGIGNPGIVTPTKAYNEASAFFDNAWESYHTVWAALPVSDPRKVSWVKDYHPKFLEAVKFLQDWGKNFSDPSKPVGWESIQEQLEAIMIKIAIKIGGTK